MPDRESYRALVVGCGNAGRLHAQALASLDVVGEVAGCDPSEEARGLFGDTLPEATLYRSLSSALLEMEPQLVVIATSTGSHAPLSLEALNQPSVVGLMVEKPMAVSLGEARRMVSACRERGVALVVNHQRRRTPSYLTMRRLMDEGTIGQVTDLRATSPGDFLSDGTHLVDTTRFLLHDRPLHWILAQIYRDPLGTSMGGGEAFTGERFGHRVESGAIALAEFEGGVRAEYQTGRFWRYPMNGYHEITVEGTEGALKAFDNEGWDELQIRPRDGAWQQHPTDPWPAPELKRFGLAHAQNYQLMIEMIENGAAHPMSGDQALLDQEMVMAVFESARLHRKLGVPLEQERYPLELMIEAGILAEEARV